MLKDVMTREESRQLRSKNLFVTLLYAAIFILAAWVMLTAIGSHDLKGIPFLLALIAGIAMFLPFVVRAWRRQSPVLNLAYLLFLSFILPVFVALTVWDWPHAFTTPNTGRGLAGFVVLAITYASNLRGLIGPEKADIQQANRVS